MQAMSTLLSCLAPLHPDMVVTHASELIRTMRAPEVELLMAETCGRSESTMGQMACPMVETLCAIARQEAAGGRALKAALNGIQKMCSGPMDPARRQWVGAL